MSRNKGPKIVMGDPTHPNRLDKTHSLSGHRNLQSAQVPSEHLNR